MEYNYQELIDWVTKLPSTEQILRLPDNAVIPNDPENTDWQAYQAWLAQGNTPLPPSPIGTGV
jgi:hypothetical protein